MSLTLPKSVSAERARPDFNVVDRGGHFAALEQPALLSKEVRAAVRSLR